MYMVKTKQFLLHIYNYLHIIHHLSRKSNRYCIQTADMIELYGRSEAVLPSFKEFSHIIEEDKDRKPIPYSEITTPFHKISLTNITFKYPDTEDYVLQNKSLVLNTNNHKIIGITGASGNGKSTIMKIALKLYPLTSGRNHDR